MKFESIVPTQVNVGQIYEHANKQTYKFRFVPLDYENFASLDHKIKILTCLLVKTN